MPEHPDALEPFTVDVADSEVADLRRRLDATRWPETETVADWSQGIPLVVLQELCARWADGYDWRATETRLNALPQFCTELDGGDHDGPGSLGVHFVHLRSPHPDATPLILSHGWPGSFLEFEACLPALTDPAATGRPDAPAFHVVLPSLPGYGFSDRPEQPGWDIHRIARAWAQLMGRLGYQRFVAAGSDWGTSVSTSLALQQPERLLGILLVPPLAAPDRHATDLTGAERQALDDLAERERTGSGYGAVHAQAPQTIGYALTDSPAALAGWIAEKVWSWSDHDGDLSQVIPTDRLLDDLSLYWFTRTGASAARLYWQSIAQVSRWFTDAVEDRIDVPTGAVVFPREVPRVSRRWAERRFTRIVHWGEPPRGGHFGAWEQPELFVDELRRFADALARDR